MISGIMWRPIRIWPSRPASDRQVQRYSFSFVSQLLRSTVALAIVIWAPGDEGVGIGWWLAPAVSILVAVSIIISSAMGTTVSSDEVLVHRPWRSARRIAVADIERLTVGGRLDPRVFAVLRTGERQVLHLVRIHDLGAVRALIGLEPARSRTRA
jgi:hypothetical protein